MKNYIAYQVRGGAQTGEENGEPVYRFVPDRQAELFSIYGMVGLLNWEWIEEVPDREYGERRIQHFKRWGVRV